VAVCWLVAGDVVIGKVALRAFAGTVTVAGTCARELLLVESFTTAPPEGAAADRVTVPVVETTAGTLAGLRVTEETVCALDKLASNTVSNGAQANRTPQEKANFTIFMPESSAKFTKWAQLQANLITGKRGVAACLSSSQTKVKMKELA